MKRYVYKWGFVFLGPEREYTYAYKWGFVWRVLKPTMYRIEGWSSYRFHQTASIVDVWKYSGINHQFFQYRPGQVI